MRKRFPIVLAAVIAALGVTAAAAYFIQWNGRLAERFGADEQQQSELSSGGAVGAVDKSVEANGLAVTAIQTLGDKNGVYVLLDVKAPEGMELSDSNLFESTRVSIAGMENMPSYSGGFMSGTGKSVSQSGAKNERYYELWLGNIGREDWNGKEITVDFSNLQADRGKLDMYTVLKGEWQLTWELSYQDGMRTFDINRTYDINGHAVTVKSLEISPLSMTLDIGGDGLKELIDNSDLNECGSLYKLSFTMKDGTTLDLNGPGNDKWSDTDYTNTCRFDKVLDVKQVAGFNMTFLWEKADNILTIALH